MQNSFVYDLNKTQHKGTAEIMSFLLNEDGTPKTLEMLGGQVANKIDYLSEFYGINSKRKNDTQNLYRVREAGCIIQSYYPDALPQSVYLRIEDEAGLPIAGISLKDPTSDTKRIPIPHNDVHIYIEALFEKFPYDKDFLARIEEEVDEKGRCFSWWPNNYKGKTRRNKAGGAIETHVSLGDQDKVYARLHKDGTIAFYDRSFGSGYLITLPVNGETLIIDFDIFGADYGSKTYIKQVEVKSDSELITRYLDGKGQINQHFHQKLLAILLHDRVGLQFSSPIIDPVIMSMNHIVQHGGSCERYFRMRDALYHFFALPVCQEEMFQIIKIYGATDKALTDISSQTRTAEIFLHNLNDTLKAIGIHKTDYNDEVSIPNLYYDAELMTHLNNPNDILQLQKLSTYLIQICAEIFGGYGWSYIPGSFRNDDYSPHRTAAYFLSNEVSTVVGLSMADCANPMETIKSLSTIKREIAASSLREDEKSECNTLLKRFTGIFNAMANDGNRED